MNKLIAQGIEYTFDGFLECFELPPVVDARNVAEYRNLAISKVNEPSYLLGFETKAGEFVIIGELTELVQEIKVIEGY